MTAEVGQLGQIIDGKYRIVRLLGTGGMGAVYEGENTRIRRRVAIKMLHGSVSSQPDVIARFEREAQAAALVGSEHICEVLDLGELPDHTRYMVMEYLEGDTLSALIKRTGRLAPSVSIPILAQILEAMGAAHAAGIVHRDMKPDNVFILPQKGQTANFVKILDFGVSKFSQMGGESMNVTRAGAVVGTPYYMSPEQARGSSVVDHRSDIYAIGVLLYQATTGQVPYQAETFNELLFKIVLEVAPPPQTYVPDLDPEFAAIILRAMEREPDRRFQSCQQFRDALVHFHNTRANRLPAFALPTLHDEPVVPTQLLAVGSNARAHAGLQSPTQSPEWAPGAQPGAPPLGASGAAMPSGASWQTANGASTPATPSALAMPLTPLTSAQSAPSWGNASSGSAGAPPNANTANSWGNASSASNAVPTGKKRGGAIAAVVGVSALLGVGGAVAAFVLLGNNAPAPGAPGAGAPRASVAVATALPPAPSPNATATPTATTAAAPPTPPADPPTAAPVASSAAEAPPPAPAPVASSAPSGKPTGAKPATPKGKGGTRPATQAAGTDLGY
jgi:serine/threonine-protein kinase